MTREPCPVPMGGQPCPDTAGHPCPYHVGPRPCTAGAHGHAGPHRWPTQRELRAALMTGPKWYGIAVADERAIIRYRMREAQKARHLREGR